MKIKYISPAKKRFAKALGKKLDAYNLGAIGSVLGWKDIAIEARNDRRKFVGGLYGGTYWGWLNVRGLWVDEAYRRQGLGTELLRRAETLAKKRGCKHVFLDTYSFHAPGFYRKLGFKCFATLGPCIKASRRYFFRRKIR